MPILRQRVSVAVAFLSLIFSTGGYALTANEVIGFGPPPWVWVAGGMLLFGMMILIIVVSHQRDMEKLLAKDDEGGGGNAQSPTADDIKFYPDRDAMIKARGKLEDELKSCTRVWAWYTGTHAALGDIFKTTHKLKRLVLLDPDEKSTQRAAIRCGQPYEQFKQEIQATIDKAHEAGVEVIFVDAPMTLMLIAEPESRGGWVRIEVAIPGSTERPSVVIEESTRPKLFHEFVEGFKSITEHAVRLNP